MTLPRIATWALLVLLLGVSDAFASESTRPPPSTIAVPSGVLVPKLEPRDAVFAWLWTSLGRLPLAVVGAVPVLAVTRPEGVTRVGFVMLGVVFGALAAATGVWIAGGLLTDVGFKPDTSRAILWSWLSNAVWCTALLVGAWFALPVALVAAVGLGVVQPAIDVWLASALTVEEPRRH